jgi:Flp pilus assembly protein TadD
MARKKTKPRFYKLLTQLAVPLCFLVLIAAAMVQAQDADKRYQQAESLIRSHQWDKGLAVLQQLQSDHPNSPKVLNLIGLAYIGEGNRARAEESFRVALRSSPGFVPSLKNLGILEFADNHEAAAELHLKLAYKATPEDPVINLYLGEIFYHQQKYRDCSEMLERSGDFKKLDPNVAAQLATCDLFTGKLQPAHEVLVTVTPEHVRAQELFPLATALANTEQFSDAVVYFSELQHRFPESYDVGYDLAVSQLGAHQYAAVVETAQKMIQRGQETEELENVLAEAYIGEKQPQLAVDSLRRAIALNPEDESNYLDFGSLCMDHQDFVNAAKVLEVGLKVHPDSARLIFQRGVLNAMQDHFQLAERDFEQASVLDPGTDSGSIALGITYMETGNAAQAITLIRKQLSKKPEDANLLYLLGEALLRTGPSSGDKVFLEAKTSLEQSVRLDPNLCLSHVDLGKVYLQEGRFEDAVSQLEQARRLDPHEKSTYWHLAIAYRHLGKPEKAQKMVKDLQEILEEQRATTGKKIKTDSGFPIMPTTAAVN